MRALITRLSCSVNAVGNIAVFWLLSFIFAVVLWLKGWYEESVLFSVAFVVMTLIVVILKFLFRVQRPPGAKIEIITPAFPSGHAAAAGFVVALVPYLLYPYLPEAILLIVTLLLVTIALTVSISRLALRAHTPKQVLAGLVIGVGVALMTMVYRDEIVTLFLG